MKKKSLLSILLVLMLALSLCFSLASCDTPEDDGSSDGGGDNNQSGGSTGGDAPVITGIKYSVNKDGTYTVTSYVREGNATEIVIPAVYEKAAVTAIAPYAFENCSYLTSVTISNSVKTIGEYAFSGCTGITSINIPESVTTVDSYAFKDCTGLVTLTVAPNSDEDSKRALSIESYAFYGCEKLAGAVDSESQLDPKPSVLTLPECVASIGAHAFDGCVALTSVKIPSTVENIGDGAFQGCTALSSVKFATKIVADAIAPMAFMDCTSLAEITIPEGVERIGYNCFTGCTALTKITVCDDLKMVGSGAFDGAPITQVHVESVDGWDAITFSAIKADPTKAGASLYLGGVIVE